MSYTRFNLEDPWQNFLDESNDMMNFIFRISNLPNGLDHLLGSYFIVTPTFKGQLGSVFLLVGPMDGLLVCTNMSCNFVHHTKNDSWWAHTSSIYPVLLH